jgi:hypothetical protein
MVFGIVLALALAVSSSTTSLTTFYTRPSQTTAAQMRSYCAPKVLCKSLLARATRSVARWRRSTRAHCRSVCRAVRRATRRHSFLRAQRFDGRLLIDFDSHWSFSRRLDFTRFRVKMASRSHSRMRRCRRAALHRLCNRDRFAHRRQVGTHETKHTKCQCKRRARRGSRNEIASCLW